MRIHVLAGLAMLASTTLAKAEPFQEVTIGVPVASLEKAEIWYTNFLGPDTEVMKPVPGIVEFNVSPGVWLQLFEAGEGQPDGAVVRFLVEDLAKTQTALSAKGIDSGEAITVPGVVTFSEFSDPYENGLGFYELP